MKKCLFLFVAIQSVLLVCSNSEANFYSDKDFDGKDLAVFIAAYGSARGLPNYNADCDFIGDGDVDNVDLGGFASFFGKTNVEPPEAIGDIGPEGGIVEVSDPDSPLLGVKIHIPESTLSESSYFFIALDSQEHDLPEGTTSNGPTVEIICSNSETFEKNIKIELPAGENPANDEYLDVFYHNNKTGQWEPVTSWYAYEEKKMVFFTDHFSPYKPIFRKIPEAGLEIFTQFQMNNDTMAFENNCFDHCPEYSDGICAGMAYFTEWYFKKQGHGLRCHYNSNTGQKVACEVHENSRESWLAWLAGWPYLPQLVDNASTKAALLSALLLGNTNTLNVLGPSGGHVIVVYGWTPTDSEGNGYFTCYDVNDNEAPIKVYANKITIPGLIYKPVLMYDEEYRWWFFGVWEGWGTNSREIYDSYAADDWCGEADSDNDTVGDDFDLCPGTPSWECIDEKGCSNSQSDPDDDGIKNDGDDSWVEGDNACTGGETADCDDNCPNTFNPDQKDTDGDKVGDACDWENKNEIASLEGPLYTSYESRIFPIGIKKDSANRIHILWDKVTINDYNIAEIALYHTVFEDSQWSSPQNILNINPNNPSEIGLLYDVAMDTNGNIVFVWFEKPSPGGVPGGALKIIKYNGNDWTQPWLFGSFDFYVMSRVALDSLGRTHLVYPLSYNSGYNWVIIDNGLVMGVGGVPLDYSHSFSIGLDSIDNLHFVADLSGGLTHYYAPQIFAGDPIGPTQIAEGGFFHDIFVDSDDMLHVTWEQSGNIYYKFKTETSWWGNFLVSEDDNFTRPRIAVHDDNRYVFWSGGQSDAPSYYSYSNSGLTWDPISRIPESGNDNIVAKSGPVSIDSDGNLHFLWLEYSDESMSLWYGTLSP